MAVTKEQVESTLKSKLNPSKLFKGKKEVIEPLGGCGANFKIEIVSKEFEGKRLIERHRLINNALVEEMKQIHALSIAKAQTPEEWKQQETRKSHPTA
ncbi:BolA-like protein 2 [Orobanche hederae]